MYRYRERERDASSDSDDNSNSPVKLHQSKKESPPTTTTLMEFESKPTEPVINNAKKRKINNIWSTVVEEQTINDDFGKVKMNKISDKLGFDRGCESYDFTLKERDTRCDNDSNDSEIDLDYGVSDIENEFVESEAGAPSKEKTKKVSKLYFVEEPEDAKKIGVKVAKRLREPKSHLMERCVQVLGRRKVYDLLDETEEIEEEGGMLVVDGTRRRTPGGVFFQLLRKDKDISKKERDYIFAEDRENGKQMSKARQKMIRRQKANKKKPKIVKMDMESCEAEGNIATASSIPEPTSNVANSSASIVESTFNISSTSVDIAESVVGIGNTSESTVHIGDTSESTVHIGDTSVNNAESAECTVSFSKPVATNTEATNKELEMNTNDCDLDVDLEEGEIL